MYYVRNIILFAIAAFIIAGCGGGNTTVTPSNAASDTTSSTSTTTPTISGNTTSTNNTTTSSTSSNTTTSTSSSGSTSTSSSSGSTSTTSGSTTASVTLQWSAPTTRADTSAVSLSDISGYRIYYGPSAGDTPNVINVTDGTATQYTVTLPTGSYYFRVSAIDSNGYEGLLSTAIQKTF